MIAPPDKPPEANRRWRFLVRCRDSRHESAVARKGKDDQDERFVAVLETPLVESAQTGVRVQIVLSIASFAVKAQKQSPLKRTQ